MAKKPIDYLNLEEGMPTVGEAIEMLLNKIKRCRQSKIKCLYIIHGYGSSGKGGAIRNSVRRRLCSQLKSGRIKACVFGEDFKIVDNTSRSLNERYAGLEGLLCVYNHGVTVIEI